LTINYLYNLLKADPKNLGLRILLAEHHIKTGQTDDIPELIKPVIDSSDTEWHAKGLLIEYRLVTHRATSSSTDTQELNALQRQRLAYFRRLVRITWPTETLIYLAGQADQLHERKIAASLYRAISNASSITPANWFATEATNAKAEGNYELAAYLYFIARHKETEFAKQREYFLAGVHVLMSASLFTQAMAASEQHLGNLTDDSETLYTLVKAARAAGDHIHAVLYAKKLLHMSWLEQVFGWIQHLDLRLIGISDANASDELISSQGTSTSLSSIRPYAEKSYTLAYEVFLENRNLEEAFRVAEAAVAQVPKEKIWHERLAQVAEWVGKPEIALREWVWLLRRHGNQDALMAVLRLAPALNDYDALIEAWALQANQQTLDENQWRNLADLFERAGRKYNGIDFLQKHYATKQRPFLLEAAARMAERGGDEALAQDLYFTLIKNHGAQTDWLLKIADLYLRQGKYREAYEVLHSNTTKVEEKDATYLTALADLAWRLQEDNEAKFNYQRLAASGNLTQADFSRLIYLLDESKQEEKASLSSLAYRRFGDREMLLQALSIYAEKGDLLAQKRLFDEVAANPKIDLSDSSRFYLMRAQYFKANGNLAAARSDFQFAYSIAPNDVSTTTAALWFLIDSHDNASLQKFVAHMVARRNHENPAYWGALAAAYQQLGQPSRAVAYYSRQLKQNKQDLLWLINYADALEQNRQSGTAKKVRQYVWIQLRQAMSNEKIKPPYSQEMLVVARLALLNQPGDSSSALISELLRQDQLLERTVEIDSKTRDLVLGWSLSTEQSANAKAWLWKKYSKTLNSPLWAEVTIALLEQNTEALDKLLAKEADAIPILARHDTANAIDQKNRAQSIAFNGLINDPDDHNLYERFQADSLAAASHINLSASDQLLGSLHRILQSASVETAVSDHLRIATEFSNMQQTYDVIPNFGNVPQTEKIAGITFKYSDNLGSTEIGLRNRESYVTTKPAHLQHETNLSPHVALQLKWEINAPADESNDLLLFGMRNELSTGVIYRFSKREYLQLQPRWVRYYTQTGDYLGSGNHLNWELGKLIRIEYPNLSARLKGFHTGFNDAGFTTLALPININYYAACLGAGELNRTNYSRTWHPHLDSCATHNEQSGLGYNAELGLQGSVLGHDQLSIRFSQTIAGENQTNGLSQDIKLNYRYFY